MSIGSDNGLAPKKEQAIIWDNDGLLCWRMIASLGLDELKKKNTLVCRNIYSSSHYLLDCRWLQQCLHLLENPFPTICFDQLKVKSSTLARLAGFSHSRLQVDFNIFGWGDSFLKRCNCYLFIIVDTGGLGLQYQGISRHNIDQRRIAPPKVSSR